MTEHQTIDDVFAPENIRWASILRCVECGHSGIMYGTHKPVEGRQYWDCEACDAEMASHEIVLTTDSVEELRDAAGTAENRAGDSE